MMTVPERFILCAVVACVLRAHHEDVHKDAAGAVVGPCAARRPGWEHGPAIGRKRLPCAAKRRHEGRHVNTLGDTWEDTEDVCGWWGTAPGGFLGEIRCERPHGHEDDHRDAHGVIDLPDDAVYIGAMCAYFDEEDSGTLCTRRPNHSGPCQNRAGYVFGDAEAVPGCSASLCILPADHPGEHEATAETFTANAMAAKVSRLLATPGLPAYGVATIRNADEAFDALDSFLRAGGPPPSRWCAHGDTGDAEAERVTLVYDALSEALREGGGVTACFEAVRVAGKQWRELDALLRAGAPLPEPWQRPESPLPRLADTEDPPPRPRTSRRDHMDTNDTQDAYEADKTPREVSPEELSALLRAGWAPEDIKKHFGQEV